jgi:hypothetical protein
MIAGGEIPVTAQVRSTNGESSSMEISNASFTRDGVTTVLVDDTIVLSTNSTSGDRTSNAAASLSVPVDGTSLGTIHTHGNASVSNSGRYPAVAVAGGRKKLKHSKNGLFVVVKKQRQRDTGLEYIQVFFGHEGQSEDLDETGTKPRPHIDLHPDGNGKYIRLSGHDCKIESQMVYSGATRTVQPDVLRIRSIELGVTAEVVFSTQNRDEYVVQEIRFA